MSAEAGNASIGTDPQLVQPPVNSAELLRTLPSIDFELVQAAILANRVGKSSERILEAPAFKKWIEDPECRLMICSGEPGVGKSTTAATVVQYLRGLSHLNTAVNFAYPDRHHENESYWNSIFGSFIHQTIGSQSDSSRSALLLDSFSGRRWRRNPDVPPRWSGDELERILRKLYTPYSTVYIVVDGICASLERGRYDDILSILNLSKNVKVFVTSPSESCDFTDLGVTFVREDITHNHSDLEEYVEARIHRDMFAAEDLIYTIKTKVLEPPNIPFLLTRLIMDELSYARNREELLSAVENLPTSIDRAYERILDRITAQEEPLRDIARKTICWTAFGTQLSMKELKMALVNLSGPQVQTLGEDLDGAISAACKGLIAVQPFPRHLKPSLANDALARFIKENHSKYFPDAQEMLARLCLDLLRNPVFTASRSPWAMDYRHSSEAIVVHAKHPLLRYARQMWGQHAARVQDNLAEEILDYLNDDDRLHFAAAAPRMLHLGDEDYGTWNALHVSAFWGFTAVAERLLVIHGNDIASKLTSSGRTALSWAAARGHVDVVQTLLQRYPETINIADNFGRTPLSWAAERNHTEVIKLLVSHDRVEATMSDVKGRTPLSYAAEEGYRPAVELLLQLRNVNPDSSDHEGRTPLSYVSSGKPPGGNPSSWRLEDGDHVLIDTEGYCEAPRDREGVARLLLQRHEVDTDKEDHLGRTPLSYAAGRGNAGVLAMLLDSRRVRADAPDKEGRTPLSHAMSGDVSCLHQLLDRNDVDPNSQDQTGRTPLSFAVVRAPYAVVDALLSCQRIQADLSDHAGRSPLCYAVGCMGRAQIVEALLTRTDVQADRKDNSGKTPLSYFTLGYADPDIAELLLKRPDININSICINGRTPFSYLACEDIPTDIRYMSREKDIYVDEDDAEDAADCTLEKFLSRHDLQLNTRDNTGRTALSYFTWNDWRTKLPTLLNAKGIDPNLADNDGRTPLWWALTSRQPENAALLRNLTENHDAETVELLRQLDELKTDEEIEKWKWGESMGWSAQDLGSDLGEAMDWSDPDLNSDSGDSMDWSDEGYGRSTFASGKS